MFALVVDSGCDVSDGDNVLETDTDTLIMQYGDDDPTYITVESLGGE